MREIRVISHLLHPPLLDEIGLQAVVPWYLNSFSERSGIQIDLDMPSDISKLPDQVELAVFRVLQECLTNVHRHSGSSVAHISLARRNNQVILEIKDRGKGIPSELFEESGQDWLGSLGVGLRGMNERMRQLGGRLEICSNESGTLVTASVPAGEIVDKPSEVFQ